LIISRDVYEPQELITPCAILLVVSLASALAHTPRSSVSCSSGSTIWPYPGQHRQPQISDPSADSRSGPLHSGHVINGVAVVILPEVEIPAMR
jgi:hypothetical protein